MKNLVCALAIITLSGCASVVNDKNQVIHINSSNGVELKGSVQEVSEKRFKEDGKRKKQKIYTPVAKLDGSGVILARSSTKKVVVVDNAECEKITPIKSSVDPMFFGNIIIGGLAGSSTDAATGKMWKYQERISVQCQ